jgi:chaperonin cofactor prefoldin
MNDTPETDAFKLDANWSPTEWFEFARRLERERDELKRWKEAVSVMPPMQEIGKEIGVVFGQTIHDKILPELIRRRETLERATEIIADLASDLNAEQVRDLKAYLMSGGDPK